MEKIDRSKLECYKLLHDEGWTFMTNECMRDLEARQYIHDLGAEGYEVRIEPAVDNNEQPLSEDNKAIFARRKESRILGDPVTVGS